MLLTRLCLQIAQLPLSYQYHPSHHQHSLKKEIKVQGLLMMKVVVIFQHQYREILELHQLAHLLLTKIAYPQSKYLRTPADQFHQVCKKFNYNIYLARSNSLLQTFNVLSNLFLQGVSIADDFMSSVPGSSNSAFGSSRTRMLEFNVQHGDRIVHLKVSPK